MPQLSNYVLKQICLHAERSYPFEACGIIIGPKHKEHAIGVFPIRNIQNELHAKDPEKYNRDAKTAYFMDPKQLKIVEQEAASKNFEFKAIYHSHPDHAVYFSQEDRLMAAPWGEPNHPGLSWIVISVQNGRTEALSEFLWDDEKKDYLEHAIDLPTLL